MLPVLFVACATEEATEPRPTTVADEAQATVIETSIPITPALTISYTNGVSLELLAAFEGPLDVMDTPEGLMVAEIFGQILDLETGTVVFDLLAYTGPMPEVQVEPHILGAAYRENQIFLQYGILADSFEQYLIKVDLVDGVADLASVEQLLALTAGSNMLHAGGDVAFGPDGYLWVALGDGDEHGDPLGNSQRKDVLYGSLLRLDVDGGGLPPDCNEGAYTIPADNPFVDGPGGACDELFAIGIRQPWRIDIDPATGDIWFADTGYNAREEINILPGNSLGGENYGWSCLEGTISLEEAAPDLFAKEGFDPVPLDCSIEFIEPVYEYSHEAFPDRCSIIGGVRYRGEALPLLAGHFIYADYCSGEILALTPDYEEILLLRGNLFIDSITQTAAGDIILADFVSGAIYRLIVPS